MSNIATTTSEAINAMSEAGCTKIMYGLESVDESTLRTIRKGGTFDQEKNVIEETLSAGVIPHIFYMVGFPWENSQSIQESLHQLYKIPALQIRIGIATPLPGSKWYDEKPEGLPNDLSQYDCEHLIFRHNAFNSVEIQTLISEIYDAFYQSANYKSTVGRFLQKQPGFEYALREFYARLEDERGIHIGKKLGLLA